jgi:hypothetical protein
MDGTIDKYHVTCEFNGLTGIIGAIYQPLYAIIGSGDTREEFRRVTDP